MTMNSRELFQALESAYFQAVAKIKASGCKHEVSLSAFAMPRYDKGQSPLELTLRSGYGQDSIQVTGKELDEMTQEFIRRAGFEEGQKRLQIGPPVVEAGAGVEE
jgi:hypothetical protein